VVQIADPRQVEALAGALPRLGLAERVAKVRREASGRVVFTTSFGLEDQAIAEAIFTQQLEIDVVTLDTGRLFPETYELWAETERRYGRRIRAFYPDHKKLEVLVGRQGIDGFRDSVEARQACCGVRKTEPLRRALARAAVWITGLRADQSPARASVAFASFEADLGLIKVNPLSDWTREQVAAHVRARAIPYNRLHDRGFPSIGCAPCTRAVAPGEPERAGRWWWEKESKKECGLHAHQTGRATRAREMRAEPQEAAQ
jgi:phosphoadenosine phosphosulfate reductase